MNKNLVGSFTFDNYGLRSWITKKKIMFDKVNFNNINKPIIIAEIGMNHNGSVKNAKSLSEVQNMLVLTVLNFNYETQVSLF